MNMQTDSSPLLAKLIDHSRPPAPGRDDFKTALRRLNLNSVLDIVRLSERAFAEQLATYNDDDAHTVYLKAQSAAAQLETLFREQQVSSPPSSPRNKRSLPPETSATYQALFKEKWDQFCSSSSIAALDSPTAYLRALYLFALQLEENTKDTNALKLSQRRPELKDQVINQHSVSSQVPMLSIVNQILLKNIAPAKEEDTYRVLSETWYPFSLPYHLHHQQCQQGLSGDKPALGELNYRISRQLPLAGETSTYGQVGEQNNEVQCQLSGLSPNQQTMLKAKWVTETEVEKEEKVKKFHLQFYNWTIDQTGPEKLTDFLNHTQLDADQLQALLAQQTQSPRQSPNCKQNPGLAYGACYINGTTTPAISLDNAKLTHVSLERFDRLQRMIRLQRWLGLPFAQLDTLIVSAMRCEGHRNSTLQITHNTLRALGVFCYLSKRYTLQAEEFAALLHQLPVHASGDRMSLFDQVFNRTGSALPPLYLDSATFDGTTRQQLCAGLGLQDTQDSLQLLIPPDQPATRTIETISKIYRQARIARLFGLSVVECRQLVQMLGNANFLMQLRNPTLRNKPKGTTDFLDMLMHLEWASRWFKENGSSLTLLRRQLLLDSQVQDPIINQLLKEFASYDQASLSKALQLLDLPQQPGDEKDRLPAVDWESLAYAALQRMRPNNSIEMALDQVLSSVQISTMPARTTTLIDRAKPKFNTLLSNARDELWTLYLRLKEITQAVLHAPNNANGYQKYDNDYHFLRLYAPAATPLQTLSYLILRLPHAADILQLPLSPQALHQFLVNPHWLASKYRASSLLELTPYNLYLMQQFKHCIHHCGLTEEQLLNYFEHANTLPNGATQNTSEETNERLAQLLGWSASEIDVFSSQLKPPRITSMNRLDWVLRCRQASIDTGLPANMLIKASELKADSALADWKSVGEAVTSAYP
ncbi:Tc toxin subunit A [Pseudomonas sp. OST1909]|uniref:Tc toxin subunit A n=1 Tax=Pseudomonas sp. OST1909 TaxID=2777367 RepID=UPI0018876858|nr:Tc toxin subunit A [Pseudomonas sp. OST1909]QOY69956.1 insecticidal toxin complex protein TcaA2 [Pseudomonas sp. OST1909]